MSSLGTFRSFPATPTTSGSNTAFPGNVSASGSITGASFGSAGAPGALTFDASGNATLTGNMTATNGSVFLPVGTASAGFLQMGPTTSAGVRIFRNGNGVVQFGLADFSANATLNALRFTTTNPDAFSLQSIVAPTYGFGFPTSTTAAITTANVTALSLDAAQNATFTSQVKTNVALAPGGAPVMGSTNSPGLYSGSGVPTIAAFSGSFYMRSDQAAGARLYVNTGASGTVTATWTAIAGV